ncbi:MAG: hypothetical protein ETSY1_34300, partial [Candidatus Entotheonella factor]
MAHLDLLKGCELHIHTGGGLYADDLLELGKDIYQDIDWGLFIKGFEETFGVRPNPIELYEEALHGGESGRRRFQHHYVYGHDDAGDFARFQAKFNFLICVYRYWRQELQREDEVLRQIVERHRREGIDYIEYRGMASIGPDEPEAFIAYHRSHAQTLRNASGNGMTARYVISLPRWAPLESYNLVLQLLEAYPELQSTIVGVDFCFFEEGYPPSSVKPFFEKLAQDNQQHPERALEVLYHVGESFFDKSLESAVRWCHDIAEMGARRLGHAIALGLDPTMAVARRPHAHETERVSERLAQIEYDVVHRDALTAYGIPIHAGALEREWEQLQHRSPDDTVTRPYSPERFHQVRRRQDYALDCLTKLGTVVETCPTSNLRVGGVPSPEHHPVHRFLRSGVNLAIGADDPGIFNSPLSEEAGV